MASRLGPRLPLVVGPFLVGVGFIIMALVGLTNGPEDYWTTFFPGVAMLGVGMGVTVAPLSTFVNTFRPVTFICGGLAWFSALMAAVFVEGHPKLPD